MLPPMRQRIVIALMVLVGGLVWLLAEGALSSGAGWSGLSLLDARVGPVMAVVVATASGLPAVLGGWLAGWAGRRLAGAAVLGGALLFLAADGGGVEGFLSRTDAAPAAYGWLIVECAIWALGLIAFLIALTLLRERVRPRLPRWLVTADTADEEARTWRATRGDLPAVAIATAVGLVVTHAAVATPDPKQAMGGLVLAFVLATLVARLAVSDASPAPLLLTPMIVAALGYAYLVLVYSSGRRVEEALYANELTGLALAMPIHYASAGTLGAVLGLALAEGGAEQQEEAGQRVTG